jgi:hypothetical protein
MFANSPAARTRIVPKFGIVNTATRTQRLTVPSRVGVDDSGENPMFEDCRRANAFV